MDSRYAHAPGQTACAFSAKHQLLLTVGPDLILNAFQVDDFLEASPAEVRPHSHGTALCVACTEDIVISGGTDGQVVALKLPALTFDKMVLSFALPVRCCAVSLQCRFIAAAGDECEVKVVDGLTDRLHTFKGHSGRVVGLALSDRAPAVASLAVDGECRLWRMDKDAETGVKFCGLKRVSHQWAVRIAFSRDGLLLAVPDGREVVLFDEGLRVCHRLATPHSKDILGCWFTEDHLLSFGADGRIVAYDGRTRDVVGDLKAAECAILSIAVSPDQTTIYAVDEEGSVRCGTVKVGERRIEVEGSREEGKGRGEAGGEGARDRKPRQRAAEVVDSDSDLEGVSEADQGDVDMVRPVPEGPAASRTPPARPPARHPVIKPNNTPFDSNCRYLCWNAVGKVMARREPVSGQVTIDVDFADARAHRSLRFTDEYGIELASVSETGSVFASSHAVIYMPNTSWAMKVNTVLETSSDDETIVSVACNDHLVYVLTSQYLRIVDCSGIQLAILPAFTHPLCVCANRSGCIALFSEHEQVKGMMVTADHKVHMTGPLAGQTIVWVGGSLSDDFDLFGALDDKGRLHCLLPADSPHYALQWTVVHQATLPPGATTWPVFFTAKALHAVQLCNYAKYPDTLPVPLVSETPLGAPLLHNPFEPSYTKLTSQFAANTLLLPCCKDAKLRTAADKNTLELIQIAIKMDHHQRALQLYSFLFQAKSRELAIQLAQHARATVLADRMANTETVAGSEDAFVGETVAEVQQAEHSSVKKTRLYIPVEDEFTFASQSQHQHHNTLPLLPSQERANPFAKKPPPPAIPGAGENYVNVMERLSK